MHSREKDYYMPKCRWPLESYTYDGLCSHFSLLEGYQYEKPDPSLSRDDINRLELERLEAYRQSIRPAKAQNTKRYGDASLETQKFECKPCGLTFRSNAKKLEHEARDIHKRKVAGIKTVPKGRPCKSFRCEPCNWTAPCSKRLATHLAGPRHAKKLRNLDLKSKRTASA